MACYRFRWQPEGLPPSPEQLGLMLGVSGTTVRRWEADQLRPTPADLSRFAEVAGLSRLETQFLRRAFHAQDPQSPPARQQFQEMLSQAFASQQPAFVLDSLFYVRARNTYVDQLNERVANNRSAALNALRGIFGPERISRSQGLQDPYIDRWMRSFWYASAPICGLPRYRILIEEMRQHPGFEERWWNMALTREGAESAIDLPFVFSHPERGSYRVYVSTVTLPPVYYLREYVPMDEAAVTYMESLRRGDANGVETGDIMHWSEMD